MWWVVSALVVLLLVALLGAVIFYREADKPFGFELQWMNELVESRKPYFTGPALFLDWLGGGFVSTFVVPRSSSPVSCCGDADGRRCTTSARR